MTDRPSAAQGRASSSTPTRRGPRGGAEDVKATILAAARELFGRDGYQATTIKAIAIKAEVDTKLVHYYFGAKRELFASLISQVFTSFGLLQTFLATARSGQPGGARYIRETLTLLETTPEGEVFIGLVRSVGNHQESQEIMLTFVADVIDHVVGPPVDQAMQLRASLLGSQMLGLVFARYILQNPVMVQASIDQLAEAVGPTLDRYLTDDLGFE